MSFFDTFVRLTPLPVAEAEAGVTRFVDYLNEHLRFDLYDAESDRRAYAAAKRRLETTSEPIADELKSRYAWMRMRARL